MSTVTTNNEGNLVTLPAEIPVEEPRETLKREALREINEIRVSQGKKRLSKLPKGESMSGRRCVLAKALDANWASALGCTWADVPFPVPGDVSFEQMFDEYPAIVELVVAFDRGLYPELEA